MNFQLKINLAQTILPYNPYERKFIKRVRENGLIEIVLPWTDKGYGMVVKTTGRNLRETKRIAEIIEEELGYLQNGAIAIERNAHVLQND